jgi:hypothetical protein
MWSLCEICGWRRDNARELSDLAIEVQAIRATNLIEPGQSKSRTANSPKVIALTDGGTGQNNGVSDGRYSAEVSRGRTAL